MMKHLLILATALLVGLLPLQGQSSRSFEHVSTTAKADLDKALERLAQQRREIREERVPLARELNTLEAEVLSLRREVERIRSIRDSQTLDLNALEAEIKGRRDEADYLESLLGEYLRAFESRIDVAELPLYQSPLNEAKHALDDPSTSQQAKIAALGEVVGTALNRAEEIIGGRRFHGQAILGDGIVGTGTFAQLGPIVYFQPLSGEGGIAGTSPSLQPLLIPFSGSRAQAVEQLIQTGKADVPLDISLGDALALAATRGTIWTHIQKGGIWIYPILAFALIALAVSLFKAIEIFGFREPPSEVIHELLELIIDGHADKALERAEAIPGPFGAMLADAVRYHSDDKELLEEVLYEHMLRLQPRLERLLPLIAMTAATAPLLGLLGTVTGMINTFNLITVFGTGDARSLSSGISEALVTTEFGLIVAIPALMIHALLARRSQGILANMEKMAVAFQNGLPKQPAAQD